MPDLLLELRSEEIPARMQRKAAGDLRKLVTDALVEAGLTYEAAREYWTPRRLTLDMRGVTAKSADIREERKGPRTDAPQKAIEGFLRGAGLASVDEAEVRSDPKKGDFYVAVISKPGRRAEEIIAGALPPIIRAFPWPKSMRWGAASGRKGLNYGDTEGRGSESLRWVRPLQSILCTFGPETEEPVVVPFEIDGIASGNVTYGHRFHAPGPITVRRFDDYVDKLDKAFVVIDPERRLHMIEHDAENLAFASGLELVKDEALLDEVANLVEWPVTLMGQFEEDFLAIPPEVIRLTIRANQKCFVTRTSMPLPNPSPQGGGAFEAEALQPEPSPLWGGSDRRSGEGISSATLSNRFVLVANIEAKDGGAEIARGNGKVVRARLSDALYFWHTDQADLPDLETLRASAEKFGLDLKKPLDQRMAKLDHLGVTFHAKLGTQGERVERIRRLAGEIADLLQAQGLGPRPISPLAGEMPGRAEGGTSRHTPTSAAETGAATPPSVGSADISPARGEITPSLRQLAERAAVLAKADLTTEVVGEFPELQGAMGRKYAELQGEQPSVAAAIEEHYKPLGPSDTVPTDPVSIAVALADKLDTLVGFWAIDEKPTGSKDPYALRRAALGVIRLVLENGVRLRLSALVKDSLQMSREYVLLTSEIPKITVRREEILETVTAIEQRTRSPIFAEKGAAQEEMRRLQEALIHLKRTQHELEELLNGLRRRIFDGADGVVAFFHDRLKVYLRDKGARHDLIDAVLAAGSHLPLDGGGRGEAAGGGEAAGSEQAASPHPGAMRRPSPRGGRVEAEAAANDDLLASVRRVEALSELLDTETGANLLAGTKRAANILAAEEKKGTRIADMVDPALFTEKAESELEEAVNQVEKDAAQAIRNEDYSAAMTALAKLREPIDTFFEAVLVNAEDDAVRANRLALLARVRAATLTVADFSRIAG